MAPRAIRLFRSKVGQSFSKFLVVGSVGFLVNGFVLLTLEHFGFVFFAAQIIGVECALLSNFFFHSKWTFKSDEKNHYSRIQRLGLYHVASFSGALINVSVAVLVHDLGHLPSLVALACGSASALLFNFLFSFRIVWRRQSADADV